MEFVKKFVNFLTYLTSGRQRDYADFEFKNSGGTIIPAYILGRGLKDLSLLKDLQHVLLNTRA